MSKEICCKSPVHVENCPCLSCRDVNVQCQRKTLSRQHEIPKCIGHKVLNMSNRMLEKYTHPISLVCHKQEDENVPAVFFRMLRLRKKGIIFTKEDVLQMRARGEFRLK